MSDPEKYRNHEKAAQYAQMSWPHFQPGLGSSLFYDKVDDFIDEAVPASLGRNAIISSVGFGAGRELSRLYHSSLQQKNTSIVIGVEDSQEMIDVATTALGYVGIHSKQIDFMKDAEVGKVNLVKGQVEHLPFENNSVSLVTFVNIIDRVRRPRLALAELLRVIREDGTILYITADDYEESPAKSSEYILADQALKFFTDNNFTLDLSQDLRLVRRTEDEEIIYHEKAMILRGSKTND